MTKAELRQQITERQCMLEDILPMTDGQDCLIFKEEEFTVSDEIIYIPDIWLNGLGSLQSDEDDDGESYADRVIGNCYTGEDFVDECGGDEKLAEELFWYCDWQHPSSALPEVDDREEEE